MRRVIQEARHVRYGAEEGSVESAGASVGLTLCCLHFVFRVVALTNTSCAGQET